MAKCEWICVVECVLRRLIYPLLAVSLSSWAPAATTNGVCGNAIATCATGQASGKRDDGTTTFWTCKAASGASGSCSAADPPVNGACGKKAGACVAGTPTGLNDNGTSTSWTCSGINKGLGAWCNVVDAVAPPLNGVCGQKAGTCVAGAVTGLNDNGTSTSWTCSGANKGLGAWCNVADAVAPPVNGVCGQKAGACAAGTVTGLTDNGTSTSWTCSGANKGLGAWCNVADPVVPPVNGVCGPKAGECVAGSVTGLTDNGTSTSWTCTGANKGVGAWCNVADPVVPPVNGVCGQKVGSCAAGNVTGLTDNGTSTSWTCTGANKGVGAWCSVRNASSSGSSAAK